MLRMSNADFDRVVEEALGRIPEDLRERMQNLTIDVADEPTDEELVDVGLDPEADTLFGLYTGIPLPERSVDDFGGLPDRILIFRRPLLEYCESRRELLREIHATVVHEVGHYFGFDEEDLP